MSGKKQVSRKGGKRSIFNRTAIIGTLAVILLISAIVTIFIKKANSYKADSKSSSIVITKSEITDTVKFFPAKIGKINMEVMAVKASDGTIRTAFNTCQICNGSPWAYFIQEGNSVICQNCGNAFSLDMIEEQRGGCNPVPLTEDDKVDNGDTIIISKDILEQNKDLFTEYWKTR